MEKSEKYIAALDIGTSRITAMVARKTWDDVLSITASEYVDSEGCVRRGCIFNVDEAAQKIIGLIRRLSTKAGAPIEKIYVGIGGQSLRTEPITIKKDVPGGIVSSDLLNQIREEARDYDQIDLNETEILDVVSPEYYLDGQMHAGNPKGATCSVIEARFQLIVGRASIKKNLFKTVELKARIDTAGFAISPLATAEAVLSDKEKKLGCFLIEFGAGVTYLSVYKNGSLQYLVTIPLGGEVITRDICSLNILEKDAEEIKITRGSALPETTEADSIHPVIEARLEEILANVLEQIKKSGWLQSVGAGIVITGGASLMRELPEVLRNKTNREVRLASTRRSLVNQAAEVSRNPANSTVIGLLASGKENCLQQKPIEAPSYQKGGIFGGMIPEIKPEKPAPPKQEKVETPPKPAEQPPVENRKTEKPPRQSHRELFGKFTSKFGSVSRSLFDEEDSETPTGKTEDEKTE